MATPARRPTDPTSRDRLAEIIRTRSFGRGKVKLASGRESDFYFDLKPTMLHPAGGAFIAEMILDALDGMSVDYIGGPGMGGVAPASAAPSASPSRGPPAAGPPVRKPA